MNSKEVFARNLKYLLRTKRITRTQLGTDLEINKNTIGNWASGYRLPKAEMLDELSEYLSVPVSVLFSESLTTNPFDGSMDEAYRAMQIIRDNPEMFNFISTASLKDLLIVRSLVDHKINEVG